jgi:hypothetical protein
MTYKLAYFNNENSPCEEETESFSIYHISDDGTQMRCYYQMVNNKGTFVKSDWFDYRISYYGLVDVTDEEVFTLCL